MKKFTWVVCAVLIVFLAMPLYSAGSQEKEDEGYTFGYIAYDMQDIWNMYGAEAFEYAADQVGVETIVLDANNSLEKSVAAMESLIQKDVDGISVFPISPDQVATLIRMANDADIPITVENLPPPEDAGDYISTVACLYGDIGYAAIEYISETMPGAKIFYAAGAKGGGVYEQYQEGVDRALEDFPNVEIVGLEHGDWQTEKSMNITENFIQTGTEFDVIFANNDLMAKGCYNALVEAGMEDVPIISTGGAPEGIQMLKDGIQAANITAPVSIQGVKTFKNLYEYVVLGKRDLPKFTPLPIVPASADELDKVITWEDPQMALDYIGGL
ncbi:MAG: sugar ABC transporter substrate-binding protein [Spirochaetota bacterium]